VIVVILRLFRIRQRPAAPSPLVEAARLGYREAHGEVLRICRKLTTDANAQTAQMAVRAVPRMVADD